MKRNNLRKQGPNDATIREFSISTPYGQAFFKLMNIYLEDEQLQMYVVNEEQQTINGLKITQQYLQKHKIKSFNSPRQIYQQIESNPQNFKIKSKNTISFEVLKERKEIITIQLEQRSYDYRILFQIILKLRNQLKDKSGQLNKYKRQQTKNKVDKKKTKGSKQQKKYCEIKLENISGFIMGINYRRFARIEITSEKGFKLSQSGANIVTTKQSGLNQKWNCYQFFNGKYAFVANSGRSIRATEKGYLQFATIIKGWQGWTRIAIGKKSVWKSYHENYLTVNDKGQLSVKSEYYPCEQNNVWTDIGQLLSDQQ